MFSINGFSRSSSVRNKLVRNRPGANKPARHRNRKGFVLPKFGQIKNVMVVAIFVALVTGWQFIKPEFNGLMPIENVRIESAFKNLPLIALRQQVLSVLSGGYFTVDIDAIRNRLLELPWVEDVSVRRQWPSGLHIRVVEKRAVAFWGKESLLSDRGELFMPVSVDRDQQLPQLEGPEGFHQKVWAFLQEINRNIKSMDVEVKRLALDERRAWELNISNNNFNKDIEIRLGRTNIEHRLARFVHIFSNSTAELGEIGFIDLRYPNGFAIRLRDGLENGGKTSVKTTEVENQDIRASHALNRGVIA